MLGLPKTIDCPNCHLAKMRMTRTWRAIFWTLAIVAAGFAFFWLPVITAVVWGLALHYFLWTTDRTLKCPQCGLKRPYDFETAEEYEEVRRAWPKTQPAQQPVLAGGAGRLRYRT